MDNVLNKLSRVHLVKVLVGGTGSVIEVLAVLRTGQLGIRLSVVQKTKPGLCVAVQHLVGYGVSKDCPSQVDDVLALEGD